MIHVCYGIYDGNGRYSKFAGTSIASIFDNVSLPLPSVTVHILHDNTLTDDNRDKFLYLAKRYNQLIKFYNVEKICAADLEQFRKIFPNRLKAGYAIASLYRLLIPKIFSGAVNKMIYLDADTIVNLDISELWQIELGDKPFAAVTEASNGNIATHLFGVCRAGFVKPEDYFNSGVAVMNLERIDYETILEGTKFVAEKYDYFDQDVLNYCFSKNFVHLPNKFNFLVRENRSLGNFQTDNRIIHYLGVTLQTDMNDSFNRLWFSYFVKTAWFNIEIFSHIDESIREFVSKERKFTRQMTALMTGKKRAFFMIPQNVNAIKNFFEVRDDEEIIPAVNLESLNALANSMLQSKGEKVFFILIRDYHKIRDALTQVGFVECRDFVNALNFVSDAQSVPLETHFLVKAL